MPLDSAPPPATPQPQPAPTAPQSVAPPAPDAATRPSTAPTPRAAQREAKRQEAVAAFLGAAAAPPAPTPAAEAKPAAGQEVIAASRGIDPLDALALDAVRIAADRRPVSVARRQAPERPAPENGAGPSAMAAPEAAAPEAAARPSAASLYRLAGDLAVPPHELLAHFLDELEQQKPADFTAPETAVTRDIKAMREEMRRIESENAKLRERYDADAARMSQERTESDRRQQVLGASRFLSTRAGENPDLNGASAAERWPFIAASDQQAMAMRLRDLAEVAAQHPSTRHLTTIEIADKLEADMRGAVARYRALLVPPSQPADPAAPTNPQPTRDRDGPPTTLAPGALAPASAQKRGRLRSDQERRADALAALGKR